MLNFVSLTLLAGSIGMVSAVDFNCVDPPVNDLKATKLRNAWKDAGFSCNGRSHDHTVCLRIGCVWVGPDSAAPSLSPTMSPTSWSESAWIKRVGGLGRRSIGSGGDSGARDIVGRLRPGCELDNGFDGFTNYDIASQCMNSCKSKFHQRPDDAGLQTCYNVCQNAVTCSYANQWMQRLTGEAKQQCECNAWTNFGLLCKYVDGVCSAITARPTQSPTQAPSKAPTVAPTVAPTTQESMYKTLAKTINRLDTCSKLETTCQDSLVTMTRSNKHCESGTTALETYTNDMIQKLSDRSDAKTTEIKALTAENTKLKASTSGYVTRIEELDADLAAAKAANEALKTSNAGLTASKDKSVTDLATATTCGAKVEGFTPATVAENPRCDLIFCRFWTCIEWCECYDQKNVAIYAALGVVEEGEDSCGCK